jgi:HD-GYP domain-containing protein (c-di-GMP phosphodiesterase class II)
MQVISRGFPQRLAHSLGGLVNRDLSTAAVSAMVDAVNASDTYTGGHSHRVANCVVNLARLLGSSQLEQGFIRQVAAVHDIGKIGIPDEILSKRGRLTSEEMNLIHLHPALGASILSRMDDMKRMVPIVLHHHERWDGSGYPSGLAHVDIPVESRIIFVADAFDAMTTVRPYGRVYTTEEALAELRAHSGRQFDPLLVDVMHEAYRHGVLDETAAMIHLPSSTPLSF